MHANGSGRKQIYTPAESCETADPTWSPDRTVIAFLRRCGTGSFDIATVHPDGSGLRTIVATGSNQSRVSFSPDSRRIAYGSDRTGSGDIYIANIDGSHRARVTTNSAFDGAPTWSPNGDRIAFVSARDGNRQIYVMHTDGSGAERLTRSSTDDNNPAWSPEGTRLAFERAGDLYWMQSNGRNVERLTGDGDSHRPAWSPDATRLTFDRGGHVWVMDADGTDPADLTQGTSPTWERGSGTANPSVWFTSPPLANVGKKLTLSGKLTLPSGPLSGRPVDLHATFPGGTTYFIGEVKTGAHGSFEFEHVPPEPGVFVYRIDWAGTSKLKPATFSATVEAQKFNTGLTLQVSRDRLDFGGKVSVSATLTGGPDDALVSIFGREPGGSLQLVERRAIDSHRQVSVTVQPAATTTYVARYLGTDEWTGATSNHEKVAVNAVLDARHSGGYASRGGYRLYHYSKKCVKTHKAGCPSQVFTLYPAHPYERVKFTFEQFRNGTWHQKTYHWRLTHRSDLEVLTWYSDRCVHWRA